MSGSASAGEPASADQELATGGLREFLPLVERLVRPASASPTRATARAAAVWTSRGWSAASRPGMIVLGQVGASPREDVEGDEPLRDRTTRGGRGRRDRPQRRQPLERSFQQGRRRGDRA